MTKISAMMMLMLGVSFIACQKQQTDQERRAEVDRQVQERLAAEHQQQQAQDLAQREASVGAREQALSEKGTTPASTAEPTFAAANTAPTRESANEGESSYSTFYTKLEPYGDWIETDDYGYVYRPREANNNRWRPYTNGQWVYTDAGWTWVSDEPFGWATYHYGRWTRIRGTGWVWVPGNEWASAWVSWRKGGQYVGWAPLPPEADFDHARGIHNWSDNYYDVGPDQYVFVSTTDLGQPRIDRAIVSAQQNVTIVNETTNVTSITFNNTLIVNQGPSYDELRGQSRVPIQRLRLQRETGVPAENARTVVRGEVATFPAPVIAPSRAQDRPRAVKQTIRQATVDRGWSAISNQREAEQARTKMKAEATPPPNAAPRKFVKPAAAPNATAVSATAPPKATAAPTPAPVRASARPTATARVVQTPAVTPVRSTPASLAPRTPPVPSATARPHLSPLPANTPLAMSPAASAPAVDTPPLHSSPQSVVPPRNIHQSPPPHLSPSPTLPPSPPPSHQDRAPRELVSPTATPAERAGSSTAPAATPAAPTTNVEERRGEKKQQLPRRQTTGEAIVSPSPSPQ